MIHYEIPRLQSIECENENEKTSHELSYLRRTDDESTTSPFPGGHFYVAITNPFKVLIPMVKATALHQPAYCVTTLTP